MLTLTEELLLLSHDERDGTFDLPGNVLDLALAAAVLMDLALRDRIDTDVEKAIIINTEPTGEPVLDAALAKLQEEDVAGTLAEWLSLLSNDGPDHRDGSIARLVERGVLHQKAERFLWVFETKRYPLINGQQLEAVTARIFALLTTDEIPDPRDIVIIALAQSCGLLDRIVSSYDLTDEEKAHAEARIDQIVRIDLVGRAMRVLLDDLQTALYLTATPI
jgi:hypothetical protein